MPTNRRICFEPLECRRVLNATVVGVTVPRFLASGVASIGDQLFFAADGPLGRELYVSSRDRSEARLLHDIVPGEGSAHISDLKVVGNQVVFLACDVNGQFQLWKTDGTQRGLRMLLQFGGMERPVSDVDVLGGTSSAAVLSIDDGNGADRVLMAVPLDGGSVEDLGAYDSFLITDDFLVFIVEQTDSDQVWIYDANGTRRVNELDQVFEGESFSVSSLDHISSTVGLQLRSSSGLRQYWVVSRGGHGEFRVRPLTSADNQYFQVRESGELDVLHVDPSAWSIVDQRGETQSLALEEDLEPFGATTRSIGEIRQVGEDHFFVAPEGFSPNQRHQIYRRHSSTGDVQRLDSLPTVDQLNDDFHSAGSWLVYESEPVDGKRSVVAFDALSGITSTLLTLSATQTWELEGVVDSHVLYRVADETGVVYRLVDLESAEEDGGVLAELVQRNGDSTSLRFVGSVSQIGRSAIAIVARDWGHDLIRIDLRTGEMGLVDSRSAAPGAITLPRTYAHGLRDSTGLGTQRVFLSDSNVGLLFGPLDGGAPDYLRDFRDTSQSDGSLFLVHDSREGIIRVSKETGAISSFEMRVSGYATKSDGILIRSSERVLWLGDEAEQPSVAINNLFETESPPDVDSLADSGEPSNGRIIAYRSGIFYVSDGTPQGTGIIDNRDELLERASVLDSRDYTSAHFRYGAGAFSATLRVNGRTLAVYVERPGHQGLQRLNVPEYTHSNSRLRRVRGGWHYVSFSSDESWVWMDEEPDPRMSPSLLSSTRTSFVKDFVVYYGNHPAREHQTRDVALANGASFNWFLDAAGLQSSDVTRYFSVGVVGADDDALYVAATEYRTDDAVTKVFRWNGRDVPFELKSLAPYVHDLNRWLIRVVATEESYWLLHRFEALEVAKNTTHLELSEGDRAIELRDDGIYRLGSDKLILSATAHHVVLESKLSLNQFAIQMNYSESLPAHGLGLEMHDRAELVLGGERHYERGMLVLGDETTRVVLDGHSLDLRGDNLKIIENLHVGRWLIDPQEMSHSMTVSATGERSVVRIDGEKSVELHTSAKRIELYQRSSTEEVDLTSAPNGEISVIAADSIMASGASVSLPNVARGFTLDSLRENHGRRIAIGRKGDLIVEIDTTSRRDHNPFNPFDVNADGAVSPRDALTIINRLQGSFRATAFGDVNGDGQTTPVDALRVINRLTHVAAADQLALAWVGGEANEYDDPPRESTLF